MGPTFINSQNMISKFQCIDAHTCGNPVRLVKSGGPVLEGKNMSEKRQHFISEYDWIRKGLMFEPRGHDMMSGSIVYPPSNPENDAAILFIETSGCLPMCGHGTIGTVTIAIESGLIKPKKQGELKLETPAGIVSIKYEQTENKVDWVRLTNVKSYLAASALKVHCDGLGILKFDVAYGGNFYAIVDEQESFKGIQSYSADQLVSWSQEIREKINNLYPQKFIHPEDSTINGVSHILWSGKPENPDSTAKNAVFYGDKAIDRSPCGTGTSARMAQWFAKGLLKAGEEFVHESYIGSQFIGRIEEVSYIDGKNAIIPSVQGWARIFGYNEILIDTEDPYAFGFSVI